MIIPLNSPALDVAMIPATSTMLAEYGWLDGTLYMRFIHKRALYRYPGVPRDLFDTMKSSPSPGKFFNTRIVKVYDGKFVAELP